MTVPVGSKPLRPARPAIWVYSPGRISLKLLPSCFLVCENTTDFAGMLTPYETLSTQLTFHEAHNSLPLQMFLLQKELLRDPERKEFPQPIIIMSIP